MICENDNGLMMGYVDLLVTLLDFVTWIQASRNAKLQLIRIPYRPDICGPLRYLSFLTNGCL